MEAGGAVERCQGAVFGVSPSYHVLHTARSFLAVSREKKAACYRHVRRFFLSFSFVQGNLERVILSTHHLESGCCPVAASSSWNDCYTRRVTITPPRFGLKRCALLPQCGRINARGQRPTHNGTIIQEPCWRFHCRNFVRGQVHKLVICFYRWHEKKWHFAQKKSSTQSVPSHTTE